MALHKKGRRPPNPDPGNYTWIQTREGGYWRRNRGSITPVRLNEAYMASVERMKLSAPAARRIMQALGPYMSGLTPGRLNARLSAVLRKQLKETGTMGLACLIGMDLQPDRPLHLLLQGTPVVMVTDSITVTVPVRFYSDKRMNTLVTDFWLELVLLYGDAGVEYGLRTESIESGVYPIENNAPDCVLSLVLPLQPWVAFLKVNSIEGNEIAFSRNLYGMRAVGGGGG